MIRIATLTMNPALDVSTSTEAVRPTEKLRCAAPVYEAGGGGINVARVVHELGGSAVAVFPAGGASGQRLLTLLAQERLEIAPVIVEGWTRESLSVDERTSGEQYRFVFPGVPLDPADAQRCLDRLGVEAGVEAGAAGFVVASGSLPPGLPEDFFQQLAGQCQRIGAELVIDTSGAALRHTLGCGARLLKPSLREAEMLLGQPIRGEDEEEAAARALIDQGYCQAIVISLGDRGAVACDGAMTRRFPALDVPVRSAVGAGDSMVAGIVLGLSRGWCFFDAVRLGMAAGAAAVMTAGTQLARRADVERLFEAQRGAGGLARPD